MQTLSGLWPLTFIISLYAFVFFIQFRISERGITSGLTLRSSYISRSLTLGVTAFSDSRIAILIPITLKGRDGTIPFTFDPQSNDIEPYKALPRARTVLITFPLKGVGQSKRLLELYWKAHIDTELKRNWIQLGSTGIYKNDGWSAWDSPYDKTNDRAVAEDELLECMRNRACVLNLVGLYGGQRQLRHWLPRVARTKEDAAGKGALHMIHGRDVSRAIIAAHLKLVEEYAAPLKAPTPDSDSPFPYLTADNQAPTTAAATAAPTGIPLPNTLGGHRFPVTDLHCYDWWDLFMQFGQYARQRAIDGETAVEVLKGAKPEELLYEKWVLELIDEKGIRALPRDKTGEGLGRLVDGRAFWAVAEARPLEGRADRRPNED